MTQAVPLTFGKLELNVETRMLSGPSGHLHLTTRYFGIAERLMRRPGTVVEHSDLIGAMYADPDTEPDNSQNLLYQAVSRLRLTIEILGETAVRIAAVPDVGYRMHVRVR